jgi:hypothetical protein
VAAYVAKPVKSDDLLEAILECRAGGVPAVQRPAARAEDVPEGAAGWRILLAEDSGDNVLLVRAYLEGSGCSVDVAGDGEAALRAFVSGSYDLVLMDVQMPVMDGYAATREIRQWEAEHRTWPVPILALTAHALREEVRKSVAAGCTAYLTKPIRKEALLQAIAEHIAVPVRVDPSLAGLFPGFLVSRRKDIDAIAAALARTDFDSVRILGHNMKGTGTGYGLERITEIGALLEEAAVRREPEQIRTRAAELARYLRVVHVQFD